VFLRRVTHGLSATSPGNIHGLSTCFNRAGGHTIAKPIEVLAMTPIHFSDDPPAISCHTDVVAKDILPGMSTALIENDRGFQIRAMAAGSAVFEGRPVRIWLITMFDPSEGNRILTVTHTYCDVSRSDELAEVRELGEATLQIFLGEDFDRKILQ
jgi:hypothetical protein